MKWIKGIGIPEILGGAFTFGWGLLWDLKFK
jgi:hypothetical protein